jgi:predicted ATP-dependent endonuclease of OLD family
MRFKMSIKNYKSFKNKQKVEFAPITIFVGPNSSGKSSILKMLEYLCKNINSEQTNLNENNYSNMSIENSLSKFSNLTNCNNELPLEIDIETLVADPPDLEFDNTHFRYSGDALLIKYNLNKYGVLASYSCEKKNSRPVKYPRLRNNKFIISKTTEIKIRSKLKNIEKQFVQTLSLITNCDDSKARKRFNKFNDMLAKNSLLCTNGFKIDVDQYSFAKTITPTNDYYDLLNEYFQEILYIKGKGTFGISKYNVSLPNIFKNTNYHKYCINKFQFLPFDLFENSFLRAETNANDLNSDEELIMDPDLDIFSNIQNIYNNHCTNDNRKLQIISLEKTLWHYLLEIHIKSYIKEYEFIQQSTLRNINPTIHALFGSFLFLPPVRQKPKKIYFESELIKTIIGNDSYLMNSFKQKLDIDGILDNVDMVNEYLSIMGLGQKIKIRRVKDESIHDLYLLEIIDENLHHPLSLEEVGYGYSQILPILFSLANYYTGRRTIIEQPELHLHPALQSKLSKIIVMATLKKSPWAGEYYGKNKNELRKGQHDSNMVILETHSEHIVRGIQVQIAQGELSPSDVAVNYVGKYKNGNSFVKRMEITNKGLFKDDWPGELFEDSYQQSLELLKYQ